MGWVSPKHKSIKHHKMALYFSYLEDWSATENDTRWGKSLKQITCAAQNLFALLHVTMYRFR